MLGHVDLPSAARFSRLLIPKTHVALVTLRDLKDMYFLFHVGKERVAKQSWGPRVPASWFDDLDDVTQDACDDVEPWWTQDLSVGSSDVASSPPSSYVQPLARVLLMGDLNAVYLAQTANVGLLNKHNVIPPRTSP